MAPKNRVSVATARFIPVLLVLIVGYASWVVVGPLSINYLINPPRDDIPRRIPAGLAIPIVYFILLIPVSAAWLRLLITVLRDPGYIPQGADDMQRPGVDGPQPGVEAFWTKDVFVCDPNGLPVW